MRFQPRLIPLRVLSAVLAVMAGLAACDYRAGQKKDSEIRNLAQGEFPGFLETFNQVLGPRCAGCHVEGHSSKIVLTSYEPSKNASAQIRQVVLSGQMGRRATPPLSSAEKSLLLAWIDAGAPEIGSSGNTPTTEPKPQPTPAPTPNPEPVAPPAELSPDDPLSFQTVLKKIFEPRCLYCHHHNSEQPNLENLNYVFKNRTIIKVAVTGGDEFSAIEAMPPKSKPQLSPLQLEFLLKWIEAGAPQ